MDMADPKQPQRPEPYSPQQPGGGRSGDERERQQPRPDPQRREPEPDDERHERKQAPQR
jgi:hypothetical protein